MNYEYISTDLSNVDDLVSFTYEKNRTHISDIRLVKKVSDYKVFFTEGYILKDSVLFVYKLQSNGDYKMYITK